MPEDRAIPDERLVVVSIDGHVSPRVSGFRPYCDAKYLEQFDDFVSEINEHLLTLSATTGQSGQSNALQARWLREVEAQYGPEPLNADPAYRLQLMDDDGIAAETVYHGGFNFQPIPFFSPSLHSSFNQDVPEAGDSSTLRAAGIRMYNRFLADWISVAPERFVGIAHIPMWDVGAAVAEVEHAYDLGLRAVNLPSPRRQLLSYNHAEWDPLWQVCSERAMTLHTHGGGGDIFPIDGQGAWAILASEARFLSRRGLSQLIFGGVFERFPRLRFFLTEQTDRWVAETMRNFDSIYLSTMEERTVPFIRDVLPRLPSDYFRSNCYVGASFMSRSEAELAVDDDHWRNMVWGRDFPHPEGTWPFTLASIRKTFAGIPEEPVRAMLGENAIPALGLDESAVRAVASRIGPAWADVSASIDNDDIPYGSRYSLGFREIGSHA
jgi:predicted TIM-barrel fold metal-dependent hydrolase